MDEARFTDQRTGRLVTITDPFEDLAFIPDPLPAAWPFRELLWPLLVTARERLGELNGIGRTLPDPDLLLAPLSRREALRSSSLEGTYASPQELLLFELTEGKISSESEAKLSSWREVSNYTRALSLGHAYLQEFPPSLALVRQLHYWLLEGVRGQDKSPGEFRDNQVFIGSLFGPSRRFVPPPPLEVPPCLDNFREQMESRDGGIDDLVLAYVLHYQFETIHPFRDGNGRVGRLLLSLVVAHWCGHSRPWLYMSAYFEKNKNEYIERLFEVSARGAWAEWIEFCLTGTIEQAEDSIKRCAQLSDLQAEFHHRIREGSHRLHRIVDGLFRSPLVTIPDVKERLEVTYPTAKADVAKLIEAGVLTRITGSSSPRTFYSKEIFQVAYFD